MGEIFDEYTEEGMGEGMKIMFSTERANLYFI